MGFGSGPTSSIDGQGLFSSIGDSLGKAWDSFSGTNEKPGWGGDALGLASAAGSFYNSYNQNSLAEEALKAQKSQFSDQFNTQKQLTNMDIYDQGEARWKNNPNEMTADEYYAKNKLV